MQLNPCKNCKHHVHSHLWVHSKVDRTAITGSCHEWSFSIEKVRITCDCKDYVEMNNLEYLEHVVDKQTTI